MAQRSAGYTSGQHAARGMPSGGYRAAPSGDNRTPLLIAIAVAAGVLVIILILLATRGGGGESSYTDQVRQNFVDRCAATVARATCECYMDEFVANVPFEEFSDYEQALADDPTTEPPDGIQAAFDTCNEQS